MNIQLKISSWCAISVLLGVASLTVMLPSPAQAQSKQSEEKTIRNYLSLGLKWRNADGDVYIFREDGLFEFRAGPKMLRYYAFARNYGRWSVRPKRSDDIGTGNANSILQLITSSSLKNKRFHKKGALYVQRTAEVGSSVRLVQSARYGKNGTDALIGGQRFFIATSDRFKTNR